MELIAFKINIVSIKNALLTRTLSRVCTKVLLHVWSYDFHDTTSSTEYQRRHIIKVLCNDSKIGRMQPCKGHRAVLRGHNKTETPISFLHVLVVAKDHLRIILESVCIFCLISVFCWYCKAKSNTNDTHDFIRRFNEASIFSAFNMYIANGRLLMAFAE